MSSTQPFLFERYSLVAPLGLRFWDALTSNFIADGLQVTAAPKSNPAQRIAATVNPSGVFGFAHLPGLRALENGAGDAAYWSALRPEDKRPFQINVFDTQGRFLPLSLQITAPVEGIFAFTCAGATVTPDAPLASAPLFSTIQRAVPPGHAVVRATLRRTNNQPAAWAVVEASHDGDVIGYGLANGKGEVAVIFSYPKTASNLSLFKQSWQITLRAFSDATLTATLPAGAAPELCAILKQPLATLSPLPATPVTLRYGEEMILRP